MSAGSPRAATSWKTWIAARLSGFDVALAGASPVQALRSPYDVSHCP